MSTQKRNQLSEIMRLAWSFVRKNGYSMREALKCAWANIKLRALLGKKVVEFYFKKTDGTLKQAFGTLMSDRIPETKGTKKRLIAVKRILRHTWQNLHTLHRRSNRRRDRPAEACGNVHPPEAEVHQRGNIPRG